MSDGLRRGILAACLLAAVVPIRARGAAPPPVPVRPGGVVRWPVPAASASVPGDSAACRLGGAPSFAPLDGQCVFPIDLLAEGEVVVERRGGAEVPWERRVLRVLPYPYETQELKIADDKYVNPPVAELARIEAEQRRVAALWNLRSPRRFAWDFATPLARLPAGGRFGARRVFNGEPRSPHSGADFAATPGTPVLAPAAGRVVLSESQFFAGDAVYIDHGDGLVSMAFHLSERRVRTGEEVAAGQVVGTVGATGRVTGPHLHFAVRWRGARVDPAALWTPLLDLQEIR